jgi:hypothetical protein
VTPSARGFAAVPGGRTAPSIGMFFAATVQYPVIHEQESQMLKFLGGTIGVIFLIGLIVVILLLMLIF